jgi:hypothetical protein
LVATTHARAVILNAMLRSSVRVRRGAMRARWFFACAAVCALRVALPTKALAGRRRAAMCWCLSIATARESPPSRPPAVGLASLRRSRVCMHAVVYMCVLSGTWRHGAALAVSAQPCGFASQAYHENGCPHRACRLGPVIAMLC